MLNYNSKEFIHKEETTMKIGVTEISPRTVQQVAEKKFKEGYYCCEAFSERYPR